jgi:hypothetical protein
MAFREFLQTQKKINVGADITDAQLNAQFPDFSQEYQTSLSPTATTKSSAISSVGGQPVFAPDEPAPEKAIAPGSALPLPEPDDPRPVEDAEPPAEVNPLANVPVTPVEKQKGVIGGIQNQDNSEYLPNPYQPPGGGAPIQVTAQQLAALQALERFKAGTGILTQAQVNTLINKAFMDPNAPQNQTGGQADNPGGGGSPIGPGAPGGGDDDPGNGQPSDPPAPGDPAPGPPADYDPDKDVQGVLDRWLDAHPSAVFAHVLNQYRDSGAPSIFTEWFGQQFNNFYADYTGYIAGLAMDGVDPSEMMGFMDWMNQFPTMQRFFSTSALRRGDASSRFASFASSSGAQ